MANSKNNKFHKKKTGSKSKRLNSSKQKENVPKNQKNKVIKSKLDPNDSIDMSKQLLKKKTNINIKRQSRSKNINRVCTNGKPIPSLADLEKMFEDSDEDDKPPVTPVQKTNTTSSDIRESLVIETPINVSENNLLSPTTINKISEKLLQMISNTPNPIELLDDVPPPPVIPQKKRKKPDLPYIVGCKDRPQVFKKPTTSFCKGSADYGVQASGDPEEPPAKRAKNSRIPNYSKSIFNACSNDIAAKLARDDIGNISDASSDSNKTIEYDPTLFQNRRLHVFSPLPSTSKDNETFMKNVELYNESLKETSIIDEQSLNQEDEVQIIDTPFETIIVNDVIEKQIPGQIEKNEEVCVTEIIKSEKAILIQGNGLDIECGTNNDDDCVLVPSSTLTKNNSNPPIDDVDEYSSINMENITYDQEVIEIIDIDDVIAENKSILEKWKNKDEKQLDKINTVIDVPNTYKNPTLPKTIGVIPSINHNLDARRNRNENSCQSIPISNSNLSIETIVADFFKGAQNAAPKTKMKKTKKARSTHNITNNNTDSINSIFKEVVEVFQKVKSNSTNLRTSINSLLNNDRLRSPTTIDLSKERDVSSYLNKTRLNCPGTAGELPLEYNESASVAAVHCSTPSSKAPPATSSPNTASHMDLPSASPQIQTHTTRNLGDCPICMDPLSNNGIASTICGHVFCLKCIKAAIKANGKRCPTCRKALKGAGGGYHQLYL